MIDGNNALQQQPRPQLRVIDCNNTVTPKFWRDSGRLESDTEFWFGTVSQGHHFHVTAADCGDYTRDTVAVMRDDIIYLASATVKHGKSMFWTCYQQKANDNGA